MVLSILALVGLIFATPNLLGLPSPGLDSLPLLIIGMSRNESSFIVNVDAAVQAYRYNEIRVSINGSQLWNNSRSWVNQTAFRNDSYAYQTWVPSNATFTVHTYLVDQLGNYFEYNVTARAKKDSGNRTVMFFTFPDEDNPSMEESRIAPVDFRWLIPRRGTLP